MAINPNNQIHFGRLLKAREWSYGSLKSYRENRLTFIKNYVGSHYSEEGSVKDLPVNMMELATSIYRRQIISGPPRASITVRNRNLRHIARNFEVVLSFIADEMHLQDTFDTLVGMAMFGPAFAKVGVAADSSRFPPGWDLADTEPVTHDPGRPFVDAISLDDWCHDMTAKRWSAVRFMEDRYPVSADWARERYPDAADQIGEMMNPNVNKDGGDRARKVGSGHRNTEADAEEMVELRDMWLVQEGLIVTVLDEAPEKPLHVIEWEGPERGPYHMLSFTKVEDQTMPLPPAALWLDLHELYNNIWRKLSRQARRMKEVLGAAGDEEDIERVKNSNDGDIIRLNDPNALAVARYGGMDPNLIAGAIQVNEILSRLMGNIDALGGLSPQAETLGQENILTQNASQRLAHMQERALEFMDHVLEDVGDWVWNDPTTEIDGLVKSVEGTDIELPIKWTPEMREGDYLDFNVTVESHSLRRQSPMAKLNTALTLFNQFIAPSAQFMQAQGTQIDYEGAIRQFSEWANIPELKDLIFAVTPDPASLTQGFEQRQSPTTTRTNVRVNRPGATERGKNDAMTRILSGAGVQASEVAQIGRPSA